MIILMNKHTVACRMQTMLFFESVKPLIQSLG